MGVVVWRVVEGEGGEGFDQMASKRALIENVLREV